MTAAAATAASLPLVMFDTNVLFDYFLGRDPDVHLVATLSRRKLDIRIPEFVLLEFRGSILKELGAKERALGDVRRLAAELDRADRWMSGVDKLRSGCELVAEDIARLRQKIDPFLAAIRRDFDVVVHTQDLHFRGDLRFVQGLPPDEPKRGVQDCRIFEAVLDIARRDGVPRSRYLLTKDSDFSKKQGVKDELLTVGVELVVTAAPLYHQHA